MLLSFSQAEGLPLSLLEAMAHGRSFISTSVGGVQNIPDNLGYTFHPTNRTYFYHLLDNLLDNRFTITEKGKDCHSWFIDQSVKTYYNQFFDQWKCCCLLRHMIPIWLKIHFFYNFQIGLTRIMKSAWCLFQKISTI